MGIPIYLVVLATVVGARPQSELFPNLLQNFQQRTEALNGAQFVQHPLGAQSYYLPPMLQTEQISKQYQQQQQQLEQEQPQQIQLQLRVPNDTVGDKKIILRLPPQQYPAQPQFHYQIPPRKHYKIILVRSPSKPTPTPTPITPEVEEKTLIYVLVKKPDAPSAAELEQMQRDQLDAIKFNKPEVFFIKYKGNETQQQVSDNAATIGANDTASFTEPHKGPHDT